MAKYIYKLTFNMREDKCKNCGEFIYFIHEDRWLPPKSWAEEIIINRENKATLTGEFFDHVCSHDYNSIKISDLRKQHEVIVL